MKDSLLQTFKFITKALHKYQSHPIISKDSKF